MRFVAHLFPQLNETSALAAATKPGAVATERSDKTLAVATSGACGVRRSTECCPAHAAPGGAEGRHRLLGKRAALGEMKKDARLCGEALDEAIIRLFVLRAVFA